MEIHVSGHGELALVQAQRSGVREVRVRQQHTPSVLRESGADAPGVAREPRFLEAGARVREPACRRAKVGHRAQLRHGRLRRTGRSRRHVDARWYRSEDSSIREDVAAAELRDDEEVCDEVLRSHLEDPGLAATFSRKAGRRRVAQVLVVAGREAADQGAAFLAHRCVVGGGRRLDVHGLVAEVVENVHAARARAEVARAFTPRPDECFRQQAYVVLGLGIPEPERRRLERRGSDVRHVAGRAPDGRNRSGRRSGNQARRRRRRHRGRLHRIVIRATGRQQRGSERQRKRNESSPAVHARP